MSGATSGADLEAESVINTGASVPSFELEEGLRIDAHHVLDLGEAVRQSALASLPMKPLCHSDCAGLCPHCGVNLNEVRCQCQEDEGDPRWAPLRQLLTLQGADS